MAAVLATAQQAVTVTATANKICGNNQPAATGLKIRLCSSIGNRVSTSVGNSTSTASSDSKRQQSMDRIETATANYTGVMVIADGLVVIVLMTVVAGQLVAIATANQ